MARTLMNAKKQILVASITAALLSTQVNAVLDDATQLRTDFNTAMSQRNVASGFAGLDAEGKLIANQIPALAISSTNVVDTQVDMLALNAQEGDVAVRTDTGESYILQGADASVLSNWVVLTSPVDGVQNINGKSGATITLIGADIGFTTTSDLTSPAITAAIEEVYGKLKSRAAAGESYDNSNSGLAASNVQAALDEVQSNVGDLNNSSVSIAKLQLTPIALNGTVDGTNTAFSVPFAFSSNTLAVHYNGQTLVEGDDYSVVGTAVTALFTPEVGDKLTATFVKA